MIESKIVLPPSELLMTQTFFFLYINKKNRGSSSLQIKAINYYSRHKKHRSLPAQALITIRHRQDHECPMSESDRTKSPSDIRQARCRNHTRNRKRSKKGSRNQRPHQLIDATTKEEPLPHSRRQETQDSERKRLGFARSR